MKISIQELENIIKQEIDSLSERELTKGEESEKEDIVKGMKKNKKDFKKRYGKDAESVMYGAATNIAKKNKGKKVDEGAELKIPVERYDAFKRKIEQWAMLFNKFTGYTRDLNLPDFNRETDGRRIIRMAADLESSLMKIMKEFDLNYKSYEDERYAQRQQLDRLPDEDKFFLEMNESLEQLTPENMELLFDVMKKMATEPAIVTALGVGGMAAAIDKIKDKIMVGKSSKISKPTNTTPNTTVDI